MRSRVLGRSVALYLVTLTGAVVVACAEHSTAPVEPALRVGAAKSASTDLSVTSVSPDSASQDTTLDVTINGSGFVSGATATWLFGGVADPSQVRTNSTRYVTSKKLIANITIAPGAAIGKWDVQVTAASKGGIGTEMFTIKTKPNSDNNSRANYVVANQVNVALPGQPDDWRPAGLQGDGRLKDGSSANGADSEYQGKFCGADGVIYNGNVNTGGGTGDLNFAPDALAGNYCGSPRYYNFYLSSSSPVQASAAARIADIWSMAVGATAYRPVQFHLHLTDCTDLAFDDAYAPSSNLKVTRLGDVMTSGVAARQWRIESQGSHMGTCLVQVSLKRRSVGASYFVPLSMIVTEIPYPAPGYP